MHHQPVLILILLTISLSLHAVGSSQLEPNLEPNGEAYTPEQIARARDRLSSLFDDSLDADKDGKLTPAELSSWLARATAEQASSDADDSWRLFNVTDGGSLDWDTYVANSKMAAKARGYAAEDAGALQAEVRRAIEEASRETGMDTAGIRVSLPPAATPAKLDKKAATGGTTMDAESEQLAVDLARDRRRWTAADANGDDKLTRREFRDFAIADAGAESPRMRPVVAAEALERLDTDGDGRVSEAEFLDQGPAGAAADGQDDETTNFRQLWDGDKNGYLDQAEMERMLDYLDSPETMAKEAAEARDKEAGELVKSADADGDGSLSKAEVLDSLAAFAASAATNYGDSVGIHDEL